MRVAFHAPLKAPDHPVPSGDRTMGRALLKALGHAGCTVEQPSRLRTFLPAPDPDRQADLAAEAEAEAGRIAAAWRRDGAPDLWFTYHNHYKAPDLLGPRLTRRFALPYVIAEASHAPRRLATWRGWCAAADAASARADLHLCFTARDRMGLAAIAGPQTRLADLPPFLDLDGVPSCPARHPGAEPRLLTVAMMRPGDKLASYRLLGEALAHLVDRPWTLSVVGDGPAEAEVRQALARLPSARVTWQGRLEGPGLRRAMADADLFVWPGFGEAFGLAYLEAQATGLPVAALDTAGVGSVVQSGRTGLLVADPTPEAFAAAVGELLANAPLRASLGAEAARFVRAERSLEAAAHTLGLHLGRLIRAPAPAHA